MIRLFHVSDIHLGADDPAALDWFRRAVIAERPDAVAITGDLTQRAKHREFRAACDWILSLEAKVTVEVGNHDLPYYNLIERFFDPYRRIRRIERLVEREIDLPGLSLVPLNTTARAQARFNWSRGIVSDAALAATLRQVAAAPPGHRVLVTAHHPLREFDRKGRQLTTHGERALAALAKAGVHAVLSGHVHDPFDLVHETVHGPIRMIGAGTLSARVRSTPQSFNELRYDGHELTVRVRSLEAVPTRDMLIPDVPPNADPPGPGDPVAPVAQAE